MCSGNRQPLANVEHGVLGLSHPIGLDELLVEAQSRPLDAACHGYIIIAAQAHYLAETRDVLISYCNVVN